MAALYNEIDPDAAHVLRVLISEGVIAPGVVDTRSIKELTPDDVKGFTQVHFFAGGGLWSVAARLAGWPDDRPIWTGSCPCQPFSAAGKGGGIDDPRHLWPDFFRLIKAVRPPVVMGEQVSGAPGYGWLDGVLSDLEGEDYSGGALDIPACAVDAPHIRQRLYWIAMADADACGRAGRAEDAERDALGRTADERASGIVVNAPRLGRREGRTEHEFRSGRPAIAGADAPGDVDDAYGLRRAEAVGEPGNHAAPIGGRPAGWPQRAHGCDGSGLDVADAERSEWRAGDDRRRSDYAAQAYRRVEGAGEFGERHPSSERRNGSFWSDAEWLACHDGKARRTQPGLRLLVDGLPGRVGLWRIAGNAIVAPLAAEVIAAFLDTERATA